MGIWGLQTSQAYFSRHLPKQIPTLPIQKMGSLYTAFIESHGENLSKIYEAMDNEDLAQLVRATTNELKKANWQPHNMYVVKSTEASEQYRIEGNAHYNAGRKRQAIELYNKAIAFAPVDSVELELAFGNRSAVFYAIKYYSGCIDDIRIVSELVAKKNKSLADKLKNRMGLAMHNMWHERSVNFITSVPFTTTFLEFGCEKNAEVPCVSAQVAFTSDRRIKAKTAITPGTLLGIEKAYTVYTNKGRYLSCYYCHRLDLCLIPCAGCTALFCDEACKKNCINEYHYIECPRAYVTQTQNMPEYQLMRKTAIKLSLKLGWDAFIIESKNMGLTRMKNSSVKEIYNPEIPTSILSYDDTDKFVSEGRLFNGSFVCSELLQIFEEVYHYFPQDKVKKAEAWDAMARVMLYLSVTYNKIAIKCSAHDIDGTSGPFRSNVQTNFGWFSMSSKLKHSCTPNVHVLGLNDTIGLVALRSIKKGEELTICYHDHFYETTLPKTIQHYERSLQILFLYGLFCECEVCSNNWDSTTAIDYQMTKKHAKLFKKIDVKTRSMCFASFNDLCNVLDAFPLNCWQHRYAYKTCIDMLKSIQSKFTQNRTYS